MGKQFFQKQFPIKYVWIPIAMVFVGISIFWLIRESDKDQESSKDSSEKNVSEEENDVEGTIFVEAGEGVLKPVQYDSYSYMEESARGLEVYLANKGTSGIYVFEVESVGKYTLWIKLSDDGLHTSGARSATVVVNNSQTMGYVHYSEDTKGWKWYRIGETNLLKGENTIVFTKNESTSAAFVMDEFKFVPSL